MKSGCKPKKTLRMAVGGAFSDPYRDASLKHVQAGMFGTTAPAPATTQNGGDFGPGRNPRGPNTRPGATPGGNELSHTMGPENMGMRPAVGLDHTMGPENMEMRPAVGLDHTMASTPQQSLRSATAPTLTPSALEQRLNDRMNAGTLTIRGAGMLQGMEDSRRQADMQRYGHDMSYKGQLADIDARKYIADMNNDTNLKQIDAGIYNNTMSNNTQNSIADKNRQTALDNMQNQWDMNQYNQDANTFNMLANNRSRTFGLRNGGEIHAARGFASQAADIKWLSPYWGLQATAAMADQDTKQDYMRAQTEALRAQTERAGRGPTQDQVNAARLAEDQARRRFSHEEEDRTTRNKMAQAAFDTKMRNDFQDRALAMQDRELALRNAQEQKSRDNSRYVDWLNAAQRAEIAAHNREQEAKANAWTASRQAATQDQALIDRRSEDGDAALALGMLRSGGYGLRNGGEIHAVAGFNAQRIIDQGLDIGRGNFGMRRQLQDYNIGMGQQNFDFTKQQYGDTLARTGRLDEFAKQQYGDTLARTGRLDDFTKQQYADTRSDRFYATAEEQRRYDAAQRVDAERYGQAQRRADMAESLQFQRDNEAAERAKREESYLNQARADARSRQLEGDFYAREDRARNYALLQDANKRLNENRRGPMSLDPRFTHSNGMPRFGLRHGGSPAIDNGLGGAVPGTGKGDKIPAMYEPNEFVVSNDMLDAEPELRDHLRDLRERVLAAKGMTVAEADAKAMGGGRRLRADVGYEYDFATAEMNDAAALDPMAQALKEKRKREAEEAAAAEALFRGADAPEGRGDSSAVRVEPSTRKAEAIAAKAVEKATAAASAPSPQDARARSYATQVVSDDDRTESDRLTRSVMTGGRDGVAAADINLRRLNEDPEARNTYNRALGLRGAGIRVDQGENGPVFSNSAGTEKLRYTGADGRATNDWANTQEYKDSIGRTQKTQAQADRMERDRTRRELEQQEAMMTDAAMNGDRQAAAQLPGVRSLRGEMMRTEALERSEAEKNAAHIKGIKLQTQGTLDAARAKKLAERENEMIIAEALKKTEGNSEATADLLAKAGRGDLSKILSERVTADNDRRTKDYENMLKEFKGMVRTPDGAEIPGGAELAANELAAIVKAKNEERAKAGKPPISNILDADDRAGMMKEATLRARAISGMRAKQSLRDASMIPWAGLKGAPSGLVPSALPERIGFWNGAATGGGVSRGDYEYGDYYLPQDVGQDVIDYLGDVASKKAKGAR